MVSVNSLIRRISPARINFDLGDIQNTVFIVGSARSGTTYFTKLINADNAYRYMFEPFHPKQCPYMRGLQNRPYLRPGDRYEEYEKIFDDVFSGGIHHKWVDKFNSRYFSNKRIVKSIRMMLSLRWIHERYPFMPLVYLMRHPLAVVSSRMLLAKESPSWFDLSLYDFLDQRKLVMDYPEIFRDLDPQKYDTFQSLVINWCILNSIALEQLKTIPHQLVFYEHCLEDPVKTFHQVRVFVDNYAEATSSIDSGRDEDTFSMEFESQNVRRQIDEVANFRFMTTSGMDKASRLSSWQNSFTDDQIRFADEMLEKYGLDQYYGARSPMPLK